MTELRIGTRGSALALAQSGIVRRDLQKRNPGVRFRLVIIKTQGDEFQGVELFKKSGIGVFTKAIEQKLLSGEIDIAVHSLKDLPTRLAKGLVLGAVPKRLPIEDVLISPKSLRLDQLPFGAKVGTGSPRRKRQVLRLRPDLELIDLRGNLDTRVNKALKTKELDAVIVAKAGLLRLKKFLKFAKAIPADKMLPAVGQGALGIQVREADPRALKIVRRIHDARAERLVAAERVFLNALHGGCRVPVGVYCRIQKGRFVMNAAVFSVKDSEVMEVSASSAISRSEATAAKLAETLLARGAKRLLSEARA